MRIKKKSIPRSLKENVWLYWIGEKFIGKCSVEWCNKKITPFTFETGHNIPESKGGQTTVSNLRPICATCNKSMGAKHSIDEYSTLYKPVAKPGSTLPMAVVGKRRFFGCVCTEPSVVE
jgi:5-methylcytosine-specific restriction endonuclease McrA